MTKRLGVDIGSKTAKIVLLAEDGSVDYSKYILHRSQVKKTLVDIVHQLAWRCGDDEVAVTVTGSAGLRVAELLEVPFVQEVIALKTAVQHYVPEADVILEMGGEDTKLVYLRGVPEQRMNNICAGGTGSFIEMMAGLMGEKIEDFPRLAMAYHTIYPIASRCAVFAKSDVRPLLNAGASKSDVAASVLEAVCTQAVAGLSAGRPLEGTVVLLGGPFQHIPALRDAFCRVTGFDREHALVPKDAHLFVVKGAAISDEMSEPMMLTEFEALIRNAEFESEEGINRFRPLFENKQEYRAFRDRHDSCHLPRVTKIKNTTEIHNLFLGIDAGSTTMKMALVDETGAVAAYQYYWNEGDVTSSFNWMLEEIYREARVKYGTNYVLRGSCIVGYGEEFCKAAYRVDRGEVETVAHMRAALALQPDVDFVMDIGGQDIKCFYLEDGMITDLVLNEACSSGCGSLFDSIARSLRRTKEAFAADALYARNPVDLGTRCSTFMDSRVKHAQKEGVPVEDIAAGVCYATVRNALFKVVRQPDFSKVGKHIVVQGGAFANDALLRAFELETGVEVIRPDLSQIMGAWGAALLERDMWLACRDVDEELAMSVRSHLVDSEGLKNLVIKKRSARCGKCANNCQLIVTDFTDGLTGRVRSYVTGNRCERGELDYVQREEATVKPPNMVAAKNALIKSYDRKKQPEDTCTVGIPRVLSLYESYPFWKTFFNKLDIAVVGSDESSDALFRKGMGSIPAEGACYPSKLMWGHAVDVVQKGADFVFVPSMTTSFAREGLLEVPLGAASKTCPLVEHMSSLLTENVDGTELANARFMAPDLTSATTLEEVIAPLAGMLSSAGIERSEEAIREALHAGRDEFRAFFSKLDVANATALSRIEAGEYPGVLLIGHAYHGDPGINHRIDDLLVSMGCAVLERVDYGPLTGKEDQRETIDPEDHFGWTESDKLLSAIRESADHPKLQIVVLRSFGCGIDALAADIAHDRLRNAGRIYAELKIDQIVDLAAIRIRLRSLAYANRQRELGVELRPVEIGEYVETYLEKFRREREALEAEASEHEEERPIRNSKLVSPPGNRMDQPRRKVRFYEGALTGDADMFHDEFIALSGGVGTEPPRSVVAAGISKLAKQEMQTYGRRQAALPREILIAAYKKRLAELPPEYFAAKFHK